MGSDMANIKAAGKGSNSNLKVPPLKIVLSSHQNNSTFINTQNSSSDVEQADIRDKDTKLDSETVGDKQPSRKNSRASPQRRESDLGQGSAKATVDSSSSSSNDSSSDRSTTTSPSSESESLDSNLTIISENHQVKATKTDRREDSVAQVKQERTSRQGNKSANERPTSARKIHDVMGDTLAESTATNSREHISNANQRITRSSQRAAQQNRPDNLIEANGDDSCGGVPETPEKTVESVRKAKRRKVESQESEQDNNAQQAVPQVIPMANICPADYKLPSHNSFDLYRDIRKRPYEKMLQLNHVHPKTPLGFKDYLLISGPYLLDGNRLGVGLNSSSADTPPKDAIDNSANSSRVQLQVKLSNLYKKLSISQASHQRHNAYAIPKVNEAPKSLRVNSALYKLFQIQEKARHQMKIQHLKERERSILATEQEILRAYNKMAIADSKQKLHLSACTYFYYQESYHYLDDSTDSKETKAHDKDQSSNCSRGSDKTPRQGDEKFGDLQNRKSEDKSLESDMKEKKQEKHNSDSEAKMDLDNLKNNASDDNDPAHSESREEESGKYDNQESKVISIPTETRQEDRSTPEVCEVSSQKTSSEKTQLDGQSNAIESTDENSDSQAAAPEERPIEMSDEELKTLNKSVFLKQLQAIDDKWANIKREMFIRHKNESDSLYAVQSLEWEWRAKEIGACDIRVTPKIEPDCVPRVEVSALDY